MTPEAVIGLANLTHSELIELRAYVRGIVNMATAAKDGALDIEGFEMAMLLNPIAEKVGTCINLLELAEREGSPKQQQPSPYLEP